MLLQKIIVCFETFVSFRFHLTDPEFFTQMFEGRRQNLSYPEIKEIVSGGLRKENPQVELGGMYVVAQHLAAFGLNTIYLAKIGDDPLGCYLADCLSQQKVKSLIQTVPGTHTGIMVIFHSGPDVLGYYAARGANHFVANKFSDSLCDREKVFLQSAFRNADIIYLNGYSLFAHNSTLFIGYLLERFASSKEKLILDVAGAAHHVELKSILFDLISRSNFAKMNYMEALSLTGKQSLKDQLDTLRQIMTDESVFLISLGEGGCIGFTKKDMVRLSMIEKPQLVNVDGAGDVLFTSFLHGFSYQGKSLRQSLSNALRITNNWISQERSCIISLDSERVFECVNLEG